MFRGIRSYKFSDLNHEAMVYGANFYLRLRYRVLEFDDNPLSDYRDMVQNITSDRETLAMEEHYFIFHYMQYY